MKCFSHFSLSILLVTIQTLSPFAFAADTSIATLNISGNVPAIFSVTARGYPGDLDLSGKGVVASDRLVGMFHFKYNVDIASLTLASAEADGVPSSGVGAGLGYSFGTTFKLKFGTCTTIHATYKAAFNPGAGATAIGGAGVDIKSAAAAGLTAGREEDCDLYATWGGNAAALPLAGKYTLTLTLTMVSI